MIMAHRPSMPTTYCPNRPKLSNSLHSSPKEVHIDLPQFSQWPWVTDPDLESFRFCQMILPAICKRPHSKIPYGKFWHGVFCTLLSRPIDKIKMTQGRGRWSRDLRKLGWFSCALLLGKSVDHRISGYIRSPLQSCDLQFPNKLKFWGFFIREAWR